MATDQDSALYPDVLDVPTAARYLHLSESTLRSMIREREVPYVELGIRRYIFSKRRLDDWLYSLSVTPKSCGGSCEDSSAVNSILSHIRR